MYPGVTPEFVRPDECLPTVRPLTLVRPDVLVTSDVSFEVSHFGEGLVAPWVDVTLVQLQVQSRVQAVIAGTRGFLRILRMPP